MKIKLIKCGENYWQADCLDLPGSPPIGVGKTDYEAIASLFSNLMYNIEHYKRSIKYNEKLEIIINDETRK